MLLFEETTRPHDLEAQCTLPGGRGPLCPPPTFPFSRFINILLPSFWLCSQKGAVQGSWRAVEKVKHHRAVGEGCWNVAFLKETARTAAGNYGQGGGGTPLSRNSECERLWGASTVLWGLRRASFQGLSPPFLWSPSQ